MLKITLNPCIIFLLACYSAQSFGLDPDVGQFSGHVKYQFTQTHYADDDIQRELFGESPVYNTLDARLNYEKKKQDLNFVAQAQLLGISGNNIGNDSADNFFTKIRLDNDDARLFDLSKLILDNQDAQSILRIDRLYFSRKIDDLSLKLGRQSFSWGNGLVFQALDPFNPFSPTAIDKDYKPGDDALQAQYLFENASDLQIIAIPRRDLEFGSVVEDQSSFAARYAGQLGARQTDYNIVLARHYADELLGAGVSQSIFDAVLRMDLNLTRVDSDRQVISFVSNIDRSFELFSKNLYIFLEYFHSGFGSDQLELNDSELISRLERGELYTIGKNYFAFGGRLEINPLTNFYLSEIIETQEQSGVVQGRIEYELVQDFLITAGVILPYGARGSEFGGIELEHQETLLGRASEVYFKLSKYF